MSSLLSIILKCCLTRFVNSEASDCFDLLGSVCIYTSKTCTRERRFSFIKGECEKAFVFLAESREPRSPTFDLTRRDRERKDSLTATTTLRRLRACPYRSVWSASASLDHVEEDGYISCLTKRLPHSDELSPVKNETVEHPIRSDHAKDRGLEAKV